MISARNLLLCITFGGVLVGTISAHSIADYLSPAKDITSVPATHRIPVSAPVVVVNPTPSVTNVQPMGLNIGAWEYWQSSAAMLQNILMNPGFERSEDGRVVIVPSRGFS